MKKKNQAIDASNIHFSSKLGLVYSTLDGDLCSKLEVGLKCNFPQPHGTSRAGTSAKPLLSRKSLVAYEGTKWEIHKGKKSKPLNGHLLVVGEEILSLTNKSIRSHLKLDSVPFPNPDRVLNSSTSFSKKKKRFYLLNISLCKKLIF